jgi:hypothetical protein
VRRIRKQKLTKGAAAVSVRTVARAQRMAFTRMMIMQVRVGGGEGGEDVFGGGLGCELWKVGSPSRIYQSAEGSASQGSRDFDLDSIGFRFATSSTPGLRSCLVCEMQLGSRLHTLPDPRPLIAHRKRLFLGRLDRHPSDSTSTKPKAKITIAFWRRRSLSC